MVCGLLEAKRSGVGKVVDAAMVDGVALLFRAIYGMHASGTWVDRREANVLDGALISTAYMRPATGTSNMFFSQSTNMSLRRCRLRAE
jgi:crotonobetainyl-CoA:carnitine CoA-transferase CaiB-like acyl-CoA transferase